MNRDEIDGVAQTSAALLGAGLLINIASEYFGAPDGSAASDVAEDRLLEAIETIGGAAIMPLLSIVLELCEQADVQAWFHRQQEYMREEIRRMAGDD